MKNFLKIAEGLDVIPLLLELQRSPHLWNQQPERKYQAGSAHSQMVDIWPRYRCMTEYREKYGDDMSHFCDEHDSKWLAPSLSLPSLRPMVMALMARVGGERLGGVLITKLDSGGCIEPHVDHGWHAQYYDKYYIALQNGEGAKFCWDNESFEAKAGNVYWFRNDTMHSVVNNSYDDRISLIVCIKREVQ